MKGGHAPIPLVGVSLAPSQVPSVPTQQTMHLLKALPTNTGMRMPSPGGWARRTWAGPSWTVSVPGCWSTMAPELTQ